MATERAEFISGSTCCHADSFMNFEVIFTTTFAKYKIRKFIPPESRFQASFIITISTFTINIIEIISLLVFERFDGFHVYGRRLDDSISQRRYERKRKMLEIIHARRMFNL